MNPYRLLACIFTFFTLPLCGLACGPVGVIAGFCFWFYIWFVAKS